MIPSDWVLKNSAARGADRLVLLAIANRAREEKPWHSYPGVDRIAAEANVTRRTVQTALKSLESAGRIRQHGVSEYGTPVLEVVTNAQIDAVERPKQLAALEAARDHRRAADRNRSASRAPQISPIARSISPRGDQISPTGDQIAPEPPFEPSVGGGARAPEREGLVDDVAAIFNGVARTGRPVELDRGALTQIVLSRSEFDDATHRKIAHEAAARLADPGWRTRSAARTLKYAWQDHDKAVARSTAEPSKPLSRQTALDEKAARSERRRARREAAAAPSILRPATIDVAAVEVLAGDEVSA